MGERQGETPFPCRAHVLLRRLVKRFSLYAAGVIILLAIIGVVALRVRLDVRAADVMASADAKTSVGVSLVQHDFETVLSDLRFLTSTHEIQSLVQHESTPEVRRSIAEVFLNLSGTREHYAQVRLHDPKGMEVVRVNFDGGTPVVVSENKLQDKAGRYYITATAALQAGNFYVSPLDLNIENGVLETPFNPMVRFSTPLYDQSGTLRGIIVLNYLGRAVLDKFRELMASGHGLGMLVNADGFWLSSPDSADEWGFMLQTGRMFGERYPKAWETITTTATGHLETSKGAFTFSTVRPLDSVGLHNRIAARTIADWKVITVNRVEVISLDSILQHLKDYYPLLALIPLCLVGTWFWARASVGRQFAEAGLRLANESLELRVHERTEQLRKSEERYRNLFQGSRDAIMTLESPTWNFSAGNAATVEMFLAADESDLISRPAREYWPEMQPCGRQSVDMAREMMDTAMSEGSHFFEWVHRRLSGDDFHSTVLLTRIDLGGDVVVQGTVRDITERKLLEQQVLQSQKMEAIGTLAGGIAHDMNNVLAVVLGLGSIIASESDSGAPENRDLEDILAAARRGKTLVENLLGFARRGDYRKQRTQLNDTVHELIEVLYPTISKKIIIKTDLDDELAVIDCDASQLMQAVLNLSLNAADAIEGVGTITFTTGNRSLGEGEIPGFKAGAYVMLQVKDDGHGMDNTVQKQAFDPFFTTKEPGKGTGLGLSMAYGVVHNHGGAIRIQSSLGHGTDVNIWLPVLEAVSSHDPTDMDVSSAAVEDATDVGSGHVLFVDDEAMLRRTGKRIIEAAGFQVTVADGGHAALKAYQANGGAIDLVILDLSMPQMDGPECFDRLLEVDPSVRVLICTGHGSSEDTAEMQAKGALGVLRKPFDLHELSRAVRNALRENA